MRFSRKERIYITTVAIVASPVWVPIWAFFVACDKVKRAKRKLLG